MNKAREVNEFDTNAMQFIKNMRISNNLWQQDMAKIIDVSSQQYSKYEKGVDRLSAGNFIKICQYFNIDVIKLINDTNKINDFKKYLENITNEINF